MGFFDTLQQTITGRDEQGRTPQEAAHIHRAKFLEFDFYNFAQVWIIPGGQVHSSEILEHFKEGVQKKYNGEETVTDIEGLQLLARWNDRYGHAKWDKTGTYYGISLNTAAIQTALATKTDDLRAKEKAREAKRNKNKKKKAPAEPQPLTATFKNTGNNPQLKNAELYYENTRWGNIGHGDPAISVGSFTGHRWFVRVGDKVMKEMVIGKKPVQEFTF